MEQNPYVSPKAIDHRPKRSVLLVAFASVMLIFGGGICGGVAWYSAGVFGDIVAGDTFISFPGDYPVFVGTAGWLLGVPLGLLITGFTWYLLGREIWRRRP
jgi:hypothetical protein